MSIVDGALIRAHLLTSVNHFRDRAGGKGKLAALAVGIAVALVGFDIFSSWSLAQLLGDVLTDAQLRHRILLLLPVVLTAPSFAVSLVVAMVMPVQSPLSLHARIAGVARGRCGAAEFLPFAALTAGVTLTTQAGSIAFLSHLSPSPSIASLGLFLLTLDFALLCPVVVLAVQRALMLLRIPAYESRWLAVLASAGVAGAGLADLLRWARNGSGKDSQSVLYALSSAWGQGVPASGEAILSLIGILVILLLVGTAMASVDAAAGYLVPGRPAFGAPIRGGPMSKLVWSEMALWLRDPTARVSLVCTLAGDVALVWAVRAGAIDPGVALTALILLSASGAELLIGRTRGLNWLLLLAGCKPSTIFVLRTVPVSSVMGTAFVASVGLSGAAGSSGLLFAEALSLAAAVTSAAALAGTLFTFDPRAPLAMIGTTVVAFACEISLLIVETAVLKLSGPPLIVANIGFVLVCVPAMVISFRRTAPLGT